MSCYLVVVLKSGRIPEQLIPPEHRCAGQNVPRYGLGLRILAHELGLPSLDEFVVDHCARVEEALRAADLQDPEPPPEWGDRIPLDVPPATDPKVLAYLAECKHVLDQVDAEMPWFDPAEGLRTVCGLIRELEARPELNEKFYGAMWDLKAYEFALTYAEREGTQFHLGISY